MKTLVIGGTGTVGSHVVTQLQQREVDVQVLTRSAEKAEALPQNVEGVVGDLLEPETINSVFEGVDSVFMLLSVNPAETHQGLMAVNGMRKAGIKQLTYMSVQNVEQAAHIPHFGSKLPIEKAIQLSGIPATILRPNAFFQNDRWFKEPLLKHGVYPDPIGNTGLSRVDVRDIAEAAAVTLTSEQHHGEIYNLVGPDVHTGNSTAEAWSQALDQPVAYGGDDLEAWEQQMLQHQPAWMVADFKIMLKYFQNNGLKASSSDVEQLTELLGHPPRSFEDFVAETAENWQSAEN